MPLSISISHGSPTPVYRQIVEQVCAAIVAGHLVEDELLPTVRALAEELFINPNTVSRAYADLAREGVIETRGNRGTVVLPRKQQLTLPQRRRRLAPALRAYVAEALFLGFTADEILAQVQEEIEELSPREKATRREGHDDDV